MKLKTLEDLLVHELKDLLNAEDQLIRALPKMSKAAHSERLRDAIDDHLEKTKEQKTRLQQALELLGASVRGQKCEAMEGLVREGGQMIDEDAEESVKDAGIIATAQRVEHYEISGYGTALAFSKLLEKDDVAELLAQSLEEEKEADEILTEIAMSEINPAAVS